jgi:U3 small nucleolar RNA-associated protein 21
MTLRQEWGAVTTLSFRTDEHAVLATGAGGRVVLWDLAAQKQLCVVTDAHQGSIAHLQFMQGQSTLVTAGADNCLKVCSALGPT